MPAPHPDPDGTLARHGEIVTITRYAESGSTDAYGDPDLTATTTDVPAIVERAARLPTVDRTAAGEHAATDGLVYVGPDVAVDDATADTPRPSTITRGADDTVYRVEAVFTEHSGLQRCECVRANE